MAKIIFTKGASTFTFSVNRIFPLSDPVQVNVPTDMTDGGQMYAYNKGILEILHDLVFDHLNATDYSNFVTWLQTTVVGPTSTFTFTDEAGTAHTVRLLNTKNPLQQTKPGIYGGTINLREEI